MPSISVILVTHNSEKYIASCLDSLRKQDFADKEVIVVDNVSLDQTKALIKNKYSEVRLQENNENFGPCRARNQGIHLAQGRFILSLDHDVNLLDNFLSNIYRTILSRDNIGAVGPKIFRKDAKTIYSAGIYPSLLWRFYDLGSGEFDRPEFQQEKKVFGVSAAAALYRKEALDSIRFHEEYLDEDFFYFFEDVDLSWRLQKKGWQIVYTPGSSCLHIAGRSRNKDRFSQYLCLRNRYLVLIKNAPLAGLYRFIFVFLVYDLWRNLFMLVTSPKYFFQAGKDLIRLTPKMLQKRRVASEKLILPTQR
jgi:GT2 family glycosyltransferase